ncbi:MAG: OmpA family protein [Bacteroidales bacterium]|nr:OmpA family protein [Bacteroidales bacterium]
MKYSVIFTVIIALLFCFTPEAQAQIKNPLKKAKEEGVDRTNRGIDNTINKGFDKLEEGIGNLFKKKDKKDQEGEAGDEASGQEVQGQPGDDAAAADRQSAPALNWAKYDFVPGDKVIFEDNQLGEENGEFPSRWDLGNGTAEIAQFGGENVIMFRGNATWIVPYLKNPEQDYLPDVFTIEFDLYKPRGSFEVYLYDRKNQYVKSDATRFVMWSDDMECEGAKSNLPDNKDIDSKWVHIAVAYTSGKLKGYIDDTRLINIPHSEFNPLGLTLYTYHASDNNRVYVKNVRIAEGGVKYYDRFLQDGKIIANGIRFDVNKATLKPESMGIINEIATLMKEHPEVNFSVEGHTDSDGDDSFNQTLSEQRAGTVVDALKRLGIDGSRMTSKGWGESKPLDTNATAEGKANNRRVEFVKK